MTDTAAGTILNVNDDDTMRYVVSSVLGRAGYTVIEASR